MPKTLDTQGFSGLREEVVRSEGRTSCSSVLQEIIREHYYRSKNPETTTVSGFSLCFENGFGANLVQLSMKQYHTI